ncbi:hypothetical protein C2U71_07585 [Burkholderia ubonensis]|nr:hypothetical protein C2U71_07585 [Burkholderia ubonensis]
MHAVFGVRAGTRADAHGGSIAQARAAHNARNRILRFTVSIWYAAQRDRRPAAAASTRPGRAWTAVDSRSCAAHYL